LLQLNFALSLFFGGEIAYHADEQSSASCYGFTDAHENWELSAVFVSTTFLSAGTNNFLNAGFFVVFDVLVVLAVVRLGHDDVNVLPYGFINCVAKHFFGSGIKRFNDAIFADRMTASTVADMIASSRATDSA